jgi:hypothetical protein
MKVDGSAPFDDGWNISGGNDAVPQLRGDGFGGDYVVHNLIGVRHRFDYKTAFCVMM